MILKELYTASEWLDSRHSDDGPQLAAERIIERQSAEIADLSRCVEVRDALLTGANAEIERLKSDRCSAELRVSAIQNDLRIANQDREILRRNIETCDAEIEEQRLRVIEWQGKEMIWRESAINLRAELAAAREEIERLKSNIRVMQEQYTESNLGRWQARADAAEARCVEWVGKWDVAQHAREAAEARCKELEARAPDCDACPSSMVTVDILRNEQRDRRDRYANHYVSALTQCIGQEVCNETQTRLIFRTPEEAEQEALRRLAAIDAKCEEGR